MSCLTLDLPCSATRRDPCDRAGVVRLSLDAGAQASVEVSGDRVSIDVARGSIWLTQDAADHVLGGGARFDCARRRRVVITALSPAVVEVRRERLA